jgi:hypothetical protein
MDAVVAQIVGSEAIQKYLDDFSITSKSRALVVYRLNLVTLFGYTFGTLIQLVNDPLWPLHAWSARFTAYSSLT